METGKAVVGSTAAIVSPLSLARIIWKRKVLIVVVSVVLGAGALGVIVRLPPEYQASAVILVDSQKIPDRYVATTVSNDANERLASITQQILSGERLQSIMDEFHLYGGTGKGRSTEDRLEAMRKHVKIEIDKNSAVRHLNAFQVMYEGRDPSMVAQVTNRLASAFIEENLKARQVQAEGTASFIGTELGAAKQKLDEIETALSRYKMSHEGELPEQENALVTELGRLQGEMQGQTEGMRRAEENRTLAQAGRSEAAATLAHLQQMNGEAEATPVAGAPVVVSAANEVRTPADVVEAEAQLRKLRARYSDEHPEVKRQQALLNNLRQQEREQAPAAGSPKTVVAEAPAGIGRERDARATVVEVEMGQTRERIAALDRQIGSCDRELEGRRQQSERLQQQIGEDEARVEKLPLREQELANLERDYQSAKGVYESLHDKQTSAEMASDMERRQKAERFTILDPAHIPEKPSAPDVPLLGAMAAGGALLVGLLTGLGVELSLGRLQGEWELPVGATLLARVPKIHAPEGTAAVARGGMAGAAAGLLLAAVVELGARAAGGWR